MKKIISLFIVLFAVVIVAGIGCSKQEDNCSPSYPTVSAQELEKLETYIQNSNINATRDDRGFYYKIEAAGTGAHPDACANVVVNYKGWFTTGEVFDQQNDISFRLDNLISGWQAGIPLVAQGGKITLYLPPTLGYGTSGSGSVPPGSILIFSIDLVKVN